jgi:hypothetical protein
MVPVKKYSCLFILSIVIVICSLCSCNSNNDNIPSQSESVTNKPSSPQKALTNATIKPPFNFNNIDSIWYYLMSHEFVCFNYDGNGTDVYLDFNDTTVTAKRRTATTAGEEAVIQYYLGGSMRIQGSSVPLPINEISLLGWMPQENDPSSYDWEHDVCKIDPSGTINLLIKPNWYSLSPVSQRLLGRIKMNWRYSNTKVDINHTKQTSKNIESQPMVVTTGSATTVADRAYFYNAPDISTRRKAYMVKGENTSYNQLQGDFFYSEFTNPQGVATKGWMLKSDFQIVPD